MAYRSKSRGMGRTLQQDAICRASLFGGFFNSACWSPLEPPTYAPPSAPSGSVLTTPPASEEDAQSTVDAILNQQMADQQKIAANQVQSSGVDRASSFFVDTGGALSDFASAPFGISWWVWLGGAGLLAFAFVSGGGRRR